MLLTHRKLLQSKAIAIDNDLRGTLRNFGLKVGMVGKAKRTYSVFSNEFINAGVYCTAIFGHSARNEQTNPSASRPPDSLSVIKSGAKDPRAAGISLLSNCWADSSLK